ncbi:MAG: citrate synthase [Sandaracinaceae bacterium]|nr:citrate synthase [Sandaracinaceae bacterium]
MEGMEGVVVAETRTSCVDGEAGELLIRGWPVAELAGRAPFEAVCALVLDGALDGPPVALGPARARAFERLEALGGALALEDPMDALRASIAQLDGGASAAEVIGAVAVFAAAWARRAAGAAPLAPDPRAGHAADYLRMARGREASHAEIAALDAYFAAVVDHGMNASTFAARVVASTQSDRVSAIVAAIGALKGRLHGGAPGPVLDMLDAVGEADAGGAAEAADAWVRAALARGERIMGMGHRVYRVRDPRAEVLERAAASLGGASGRLALARAVEAAADRALSQGKPGRALRANVEMYTAVLLDALGLARALFTPTFACARVAGWCAHYDEQRQGGRLIRPRARYVGPGATDRSAA